MDDPGIPRRRTSDATIELILYRLDELKASVKEGFGRHEVVHLDHERRIVSLENKEGRRSEREAVAAQQSQSVDTRWIPLLGILLAVLVAAGSLILALGGTH